ncbi:MAG: CobW family GTP-binding protein [Methylococcaceae bacterium]
MLREHNAPLSMLVGGCLCCQVRGSLTPLLKNLRMAWEAKPVKPFARIFIETSGVANPEVVLGTLLRERWLATRYRLQGMIATVSAVSGADTLSCFPEAQAQIAWADTLVITQTDLADTKQIDQLIMQLDSLAPAATRLQAVQGNIDPEALLSFAGVDRYRLKSETALPEHGFNSITLQFDHQLRWEYWQMVLENSLGRQTKRWLRLKGVIYTPDDNCPLLVQGATGRLYPPVRLPPENTNDSRSRLVLITDGDVNNLAEEVMQAMRDVNSMAK